MTGAISPNIIVTSCNRAQIQAARWGERIGRSFWQCRVETLYSSRSHRGTTTSSRNDDLSTKPPLGRGRKERLRLRLRRRSRSQNRLAEFLWCLQPSHTHIHAHMYTHTHTYTSPYNNATLPSMPSSAAIIRSRRESRRTHRFRPNSLQRRDFPRHRVAQAVRSHPLFPTTRN